MSVGDGSTVDVASFVDGETPTSVVAGETPASAVDGETALVLDGKTTTSVVDGETSTSVVDGETSASVVVVIDRQVWLSSRVNPGLHSYVKFELEPGVAIH